ncbi:MAG: glycogen synthase GlgA [Campylobacterales bacterium]|nr:glycogen synthase GlgA [Campylobacterales bacterium]
MKDLKVLIVASECVPFAKTGGLADVVGTLPKYLKKAGVDVRVVIPRYYKIDRTKLTKHHEPLGVNMGTIGEQWCGVYEGVLPNSDVPIYFLDHENYFGRENLYTEHHGEGFLDNDNRFVFLSKASFILCKMLNFQPDIIHTNDWHSAIMTVLLNTLYKDDPFFSKTASVLTIHNMQYQGIFYKGIMDVLGIDWKHFNYLELEFKDCVNFLKGGIYHANAINSVSEGYVREIQTSEYGYELDGVIRDRFDSLYGILNGCDYDEWNPKKDKYIAQNYSRKNLDGKKVCKEDLQKTFNLPIRDDVPIIGMVTRLVHQKGIDVVAEAIENILSLDVQMVLVGNGEVWAHFYFGDIMARYPHKFACFIGYNEALAHKVEAGSDFFLMPSRFEPCGLNQMYSLKYGTVPIVRATGGLDDTVVNFDEKKLKGTGFKFYQLDSNSLYNTVGWAVYTYYNNKKGMEKLINRGMKQKFTWEESAQKYIDLYHDAINKKFES